MSNGNEMRTMPVWPDLGREDFELALVGFNDPAADGQTQAQPDVARGEERRDGASACASGVNPLPLSCTSIVHDGRPLSPSDSVRRRRRSSASAGLACSALSMTSVSACLSAARSPVTTMGLPPVSH